VPLDGSGAKVLFEDSRYDVEGVVYDSYSWEPIGARIGGPEPRVHWFDATAEARYNALSRSFAGRDVSIYGRNAEGTRVIVGVGAHAAPTTYYLVDFSKGTADIVGEEYPALAGVTLGEVRTISYKARDGYEIPAYITLPPGVAAEKLPLVVMPHGGPESRDEPDFDPFAQFLATRGYAVLQPQFRGSTGFGEAHRQAGVRQWGGLMQDDVTDGVKALIEQGLADPRRVCIVGMSYGGYAALAGAAFTPDLYACAASVSGVSDLPAMLGHVQRKSGKDSDQLAYWNGHIGEASDRRVIDKSPARAAANVRVPILLVHGVDDVVVPLSQSETMARALKDAGKSFRLVKMTGEDHWLSRSETRLTVMEELETFLAANLAVRSP
jgi:dipeptidyl aminopeptidase/acylaminoacyl peptidase